MSIIKRNGKYYCRFQIDGERHHYLCAGAKDEKEAKKIEQGFMYKVQQQQNGIIPKDKKKVRFSTLYELYDDYSKLNKKSHSKDVSFIRVLKSYIKPEVVCSDLTPKYFEKLKAEFIDNRKVTQSTVNKYLCIISKMYNLAISEKLVDENPLSSVKVFPEKNYKVRYLTKEEEKRLYNSIDEIRPHLRPLVTAALQTGMRRGEIFSLKWDNVYFDYGFIEVLESKSGKSRKVPLSNKMRELLEKLPKDDKYVFINKDTGKPYTDIKHGFHTVLEKAHIANFRFHDLRHTVATRMVEKGIPLPVVQEIMGHAKISTTMRYTHVVPYQKLDAISVLDNYCD